MKKLILLACLLTCGYVPAQAGTDYACLNDCTGRGYLYNLCKERCTYGGQPQQQNSSGPTWDNPIGQRIQAEELKAAKIRNQQMQLQMQQQQEEAQKRQRILDLQLEEAEARAAERRQKQLKKQEPEKPKCYIPD